MNINSAEILLSEATSLIHQNIFEEALAKSNKSFELHPTVKSAYLSQWSSLKLQRFDESIEIGHKGLNLLESMQQEAARSSYRFKLSISISKALKQKGDLPGSKSILQTLLPQVSAKDQIELIKDYMKKLDEMENWTADYQAIKFYNDSYRMRPGDKFFIVDAKWYSQWEKYNTGVSPCPPPEICNAKLLKQNLQDKYKIYVDPEETYTHNILKSKFSENLHYVILPEFSYLKIKEKHSPVDFEIIRYCVPVDGNQSITQVEVTLQKLLISLLPSCKGVPDKYIYISKTKTVGELREVIQKQIKDDIEKSDLDFNELKIWKAPSSVNLKLIDERQHRVCIAEAMLLCEPNTIEDSEIAPDDLILFEFRKKNSGTWSITNKKQETCASCHKAGSLQSCSKCKTTKYCSTSCQQSHFKYHKPNCKSSQMPDPKKRGRRGMVGLQNLGNTCFMNSALQCISNTLPLTQYFLEGSYREDLNHNNPLGTKGAALALAYADLAEDMWNGTSAVVSPWNLKKVISVFATQFSGYAQHDSHELLSYLLTGLHEDLNKVKTKKYVELPDLADKPENIAADIQWGLFLQRNQSVIVDMMYGQNKSTLVCPVCGKVSITFDPFLSLSVVVPNTEAVVLTVFANFQDPERNACRFKVAIEPRACVKKVKDYFEKYLGAKFVVYLQEKFFFKGFCREDVRVENLRDVIYLYEVPGEVEGFQIIPINLAKTGEKGYVYNSNKSPVSYPRLIFVKRTSSTYEIFKEIALIFRKLFKDNSQNIPDTIEDHENNPLYQVKVQRKGKSLCNFCQSKCEGCKLPISDSTSIIDTIDRWNNPAETFILDIEFSKGTRGIDRLNKYSEENNINLAQKMKLDINYCLELTSQPEKLDESNKWYCGNCKDHVCATKQLKIYKLPNILIVHLLRFKKKGIWTEKVTTGIDFPIENFSLNSISEADVLYDLYAVSNHFGGTGGGHYTAYVKNPAADNWLEMDDSHVTSVSASQIVSSSAYILFYKRKQA